jgi:hydrogenase maturation protease
VDPERVKEIPLLVLGLGNLLCSDDGLGAAAAQRLLEEWEPPDGVRVLDGGTLGLALLPYLEDARDVILLDAIRADGPVGSFVRLEGDDVAPAVATRLSPHQIGVADLLDGARWRGRYPERLVLLGLVPASIELSLDLSPEVERQLPRLTAAAVKEAGALGYVFRRRTHADAQGPDPGAPPERLGLLAVDARSAR